MMMDEREVISPANRAYRPAALWAARVVVAMICIWNLTAAVPFVLNPAGYAHSFEVSDCGIGGEVLVRGLGIAFLMWQVPFLPVIWHPGRQRTLFLCLLGMQLVGLVGESAMMAALPAGHAALRATGWRFILFDGAGLVGLGVTYGTLHRKRKSDPGIWLTPHPRKN
jgi:hypothetical protein